MAEEQQNQATLSLPRAPGSSVPTKLAPLRSVDRDRYEVRNEHGRGGLGVVLRVFDRQFGREWR